nr:ribonuclease H-like domain-containing protein [Tanacetum cinerariifolium]
MGKQYSLDDTTVLESFPSLSTPVINRAGNAPEKKVAYPVVANCVWNTWGKYGIICSMFSSTTGLFSFQFSSIDGLDAMLKNGAWFIQNNPVILKKWHPNENLLKEDVILFQFGLNSMVYLYSLQGGRGFSSMNIDNDGEFASNTSIGVKIDKIERQICKGKLRLLDYDGNPLVPTDKSDKGCGTNSLLEQWRDSYPDNDDYNPYDDDIYENHDLFKHLQSICDKLDITQRLVENPQSAKETWDILTDIFHDDKRTCSIALNVELLLTSLGSPMNLDDVVTFAFEGLPAKYDNVFTIIAHRGPFSDLKTVQSMLTTEEMRLKSQEQDTLVDASSSSPMVYLANSDSNVRRSSSSKEKPWPMDANIVRCMWLFRHKFLADGTLSHYNARFVANGSTQIEGIDLDETFSVVVKPDTI